MLFSQRDIDVLKVLYWCQYLSPKSSSAVFEETALSNLHALGLIKLHRASGNYVLTENGKAILQAHFKDSLPAFSQSYHEHFIQRRLRLCSILLTFYQAGFSVFTRDRESLLSTCSYYMPAVTRGRLQNVWGSTRIAGIANLGDLLCAVHYVCPGIGRLALNDELAAFHNQTDRIPAKQRGFLFAGGSYEDIRQALREELPARGSVVSYGEAYQSLRLPIFFLSCDEVGAKQLQLMSLANHRQRLSKAALQGAYQAPPEAVPEWDAMFDGRPFVLAVEMDLRRIDAAILKAKAHGYSQIAIAALEEQNAALLSPLYRDTGLAHTYSLSPTAIREALGAPLSVKVPDSVFLTSEGGVVHAPLIRTNRKTGK